MVYIFLKRNIMGNLNSSQEMTMENLYTQLNILNHKMNYCLSQLDTLKYKVKDMEKVITDYELEDYNDVFYDNISPNTNNTNSNNSNSTNSISISNINEYTWDYYEIDNTHINNVDAQN